METESSAPMPELRIEQFQCGPMQNFVYLIGSRRTREVVLVDPAWSIEALLAHLDEQDLTPVGVLATHYHPDHVGGDLMGHHIEGVADLIARRPMKVYVNEHEAEGLRKITGLSDSDLVKADSGYRLKVGGIEIELLHTPGHTPGSQCFRIRNHLVSGDTLFIQGCGRVDLPGSDPDQMYWSLRKLASLPDDTVVLPGHDYGGGASQPLGTVRRVNPYLRIESLDLWHQTMGH